MGVATAQGRPYYLFTRWLRGLNIKFDVLKPDEIPNYTGDVILTTREEFPSKSDKILLYDDEMKHGSTITLVLLLQRCGITGDDLIVGIDPGRRIGLSVFYGSVEIERQLFISIERMSSHIRYIFKYIKSTRHLIRIGDGDMTTAWRICRMLDVINTPYSLEFVNESGTSPRTRHCNSRGKQDMLAARAIAQRDPWVMV